jgi:hypothetical protein
MSFLDYVGKWPGMRQSRDEGMHSYAGHPSGRSGRTLHTRPRILSRLADYKTLQSDEFPAPADCIGMP